MTATITGLKRHTFRLQKTETSICTTPMEVVVEAPEDFVIDQDGTFLNSEGKRMFIGDLAMHQLDGWKGGHLNHLEGLPLKIVSHKKNDREAWDEVTDTSYEISRT